MLKLDLTFDVEHEEAIHGAVHVAVEQFSYIVEDADTERLVHLRKAHAAQVNGGLNDYSQSAVYS